jgi:hypothetical protein
MPTPGQTDGQNPLVSLITRKRKKQEAEVKNKRFRRCREAILPL